MIAFTKGYTKKENNTEGKEQEQWKEGRKQKKREGRGKKQ